MSFNQDIVLPPFLDETSSEPSRGRSALTLEELDVGRDLVDFKLVSNNEEETSSFYLSLSKWTARELEVLVNFTEPALVSNG